jgi:hypothetical protein
MVLLNFLNIYHQYIRQQHQSTMLNGSLSFNKAFIFSFSSAEALELRRAASCAKYTALEYGFCILKPNSPTSAISSSNLKPPEPKPFNFTKALSNPAVGLP